MKKILLLVLVMLLMSACSSYQKEEKLVSELLENAYKYSKYLYEEQEVTEYEYELEGIKYKVVMENDAQTEDNVRDLVNTTFIETNHDKIRELEKSRYYYALNIIYVRADMNKGCTLEEYDFSKVKITKIKDDIVTFKFNGEKYKAIIKDGKYYLEDVIFKCPNS